MDVSSYKYILIEDDQHVYTSIRERMSVFSAWEPVAFVASYTESLRIIHESRPHLIFMDWDIKGGNGFMLLEEIRKMTDYRPYIIFFTGFQSDQPEIAEVIMNQYRLMVHHYILKPIWSTLTKNLHQYIQEAESDLSERKTLLAECWLETLDKQQVKIQPNKLIYIEQSPLSKFHKVLYFDDLKRLELKLSWADCFDIMRRHQIEYFVPCYRKNLINLAYIQRIHRPKLFLANSLVVTVSRNNWGSLVRKLNGT